MCVKWPKCTFYSDIHTATVLIYILQHLHSSLVILVLSALDRLTLPLRSTLSKGVDGVFGTTSGLRDAVVATCPGPSTAAKCVISTILRSSVFIFELCDVFCAASTRRQCNQTSQNEPTVPRQGHDPSPATVMITADCLWWDRTHWEHLYDITDITQVPVMEVGWYSPVHSTATFTLWCIVTYFLLQHFSPVLFSVLSISGSLGDSQWP